MPDHPNVKLIKDVFEAYARRDLPVIAGFMAEDMVFHFPGRNPFSGDYEGRDATLRMLAQVGEIDGGKGQIDIHDVVGNDEHVAVLLTAHASRVDSGKELHVREIQIFHVNDGKITEQWVFSEDQRLNDEYWSG